MAPIQKMGVCPTVPAGNAKIAGGTGTSSPESAANGAQRRMGGVQAGGEAQAELEPRLRFRGGEIERAFGEQRRRDAELAVPFEAGAREPGAHAGVDRQSPLSQPHASHGVVDGEQRRHADLGTDPSAPGRPAQLGSELTDPLLRSDATHHRRSQHRGGRAATAIIDVGGAACGTTGGGIAGGGGIWAGNWAGN